MFRSDSAPEPEFDAGGAPEEAEAEYVEPGAGGDAPSEGAPDAPPTGGRKRGGRRRGRGGRSKPDGGGGSPEGNNRGGGAGGGRSQAREQGSLPRSSPQPARSGGPAQPPQAKGDAKPKPRTLYSSRRKLAPGDLKNLKRED